MEKQAAMKLPGLTICGYIKADFLPHNSFLIRHCDIVFSYTSVEFYNTHKHNYNLKYVKFSIIME